MPITNVYYYLKCEESVPIASKATRVLGESLLAGRSRKMFLDFGTLILMARQMPIVSES